MTFFSGAYDGLVQSFARQTITVTERAAGSYVNGRYQAGSTTPSTVLAAVYPATGDVLQRLPEARRSDETIVIHTATELFSSTPNGRQADRITYDGKTWEVANVKRWASDGYEVLAQRVGQS